jgi:hypothetical protein
MGFPSSESSLSSYVGSVNILEPQGHGLFIKALYYVSTKNKKQAKIFASTCFETLDPTRVFEGYF